MKPWTLLLTLLSLGGTMLATAPHLASCALFSSSSSSSSSSGASGSGMFGGMDLPFKPDALSNLFDTQTVSMVPTRLKQYGTKATDALKRLSTDNNVKVSTELRDAATEALKTGSVDKVLKLAASQSETDEEELRQNVRDYAGEYANYVDFFWGLSAVRGGGEPPQKLKSAIDKSFGSLDELKKDMAKHVDMVLGSGWVWLVADEKASLSVTCSHQVRTRPAPPKRVVLALMVSDSTLGKFTDDKTKYVDTFFNYVDWNQALKRFEGESSPYGHQMQQEL